MGLKWSILMLTVDYRRRIVLRGAPPFDSFSGITFPS